MLAATSKFLRQIIPPVIATLIAAVLIAGFNRAFSTHLTQPRLGGLNASTSAEAPDERVMPQPAAVRPTWTAEAVDEPAPVREWQKGGVREAAKDPAGTRTAETTPAAPPAPVVARKEARPAESRQAEPRQIESRQVATRQAPVIATPVMAPPPPVVTAPPVMHGPPPIVMAPPVAAPVAVAPPVIVAAPMRQDMMRQDMPREEMVAAEPPMVTVPDRPRSQPQPQYADQSAPPPPQGPIGTIASTLNPSTWFARAREFGEKIEAVGNEILPNIRQ